MRQTHRTAARLLRAGFATAIGSIRRRP